jgi:hypothetical protein
MTIDIPGNENETAYLGFAVVDALIELLVAKKIISGPDVTIVVKAAGVRLSKINNFDAQRAAKFIADRMGS